MSPIKSPLKGALPRAPGGLSIPASEYRHTNCKFAVLKRDVFRFGTPGIAGWTS